MTRTPKSMVVAGVMSGTSADGVDVAAVRVSPGRGTEAVPRLKLLGYRSFAYPKAVRAAVLAAMDARAIRVAELARLNWRLGEVYADAVEKTVASVGVKIALVAMHGQTIYHQATPAAYAGKPVRATWQIGEAAAVAERLGVPVVSDFRSADLAAGGQAAPLVPMLDYTMFRSATKNRVLLNLGGIANVTAIPAGAGLDGLLAFDTGPANMMMDALMLQFYGKSFDRGGVIGGRGRVLSSVVARVLRGDYFAAAPPKSCGREQFGAVFVERFRAMCAQAGGSEADMVATATELTVASILDAYGRFCWTHFGQMAPAARATELLAAGGGTRNAFLMKRLFEGFAMLGVRVRPLDEAGLPSQAKEAAAFALLGWLSWHGLPGNVPAATGAAHNVVLGKVTCG